jgi:hypothetical protein
MKLARCMFLRLGALTAAQPAVSPIAQAQARPLCSLSRAGRAQCRRTGNAFPVAK